MVKYLSNMSKALVSITREKKLKKKTKQQNKTEVYLEPGRVAYTCKFI